MGVTCVKHKNVRI